MSPLLEARDLAVHRGGTRVLQVPTLALRPGASMALIGPNGSGKSTLLLALAALLPWSGGTLSFRQNPVATERERLAYRRHVAVVFQEPLLFDTTVAHNLEAGLRLRGVPTSARRARVRTAAERFGIAHLLDRAARKLSGGEAQRTSLARAFVLEPEILFLDEPFTALDPPTREALTEDLTRILAETRTAVVLATHDLEEALRLTDTLALLRDGSILQAGPAMELINRPCDAFVASFVGMETLLDGVVASCRDGMLVLRIGDREVEALGQGIPGHTVRVGIRPENVVLAAEARGSARNAFPATVTRIVPRGPFCKVELDCGFFLAACITARSREELGLVEGACTTAAFKATAVHVIRS